MTVSDDARDQKRGAAERITAAVGLWPGVQTLPHRFGGVEIRFGRLRFLAPARGPLTGRCRFEPDAVRLLCALYGRDQHKAEVASGDRLCRRAGAAVRAGSFTWKLRRA